jgi:predicted ATPase
LGHKTIQLLTCYLFQPGYRFALLAKSLIKKFDAKESEAEVLCVAIAVQSYVEPLLSTMECLHEAESMAISVGDFYWACILTNFYVSDGLWAGVNLSQLNVRLSDTIAFMHRHNHKPLLPIMSIGQGTFNVLLGNEALSLTSDTPLPKTALMVL